MAMQRYLLLAGAASSARSRSSIHLSLSTIRSLSPLSSLLSPLSSLLSLQLGWGFFLDVRLWAGSREYDPCMYSSSSTGCCACSKPTVRSKRPELEATTNDVMLLVLQVASTSCHLLHGANGNVCQKLFSSTHSAFFPCIRHSSFRPFCLTSVL